jgi:hypothetical protein
VNAISHQPLHQKKEKKRKKKKKKEKKEKRKKKRKKEREREDDEEGGQGKSAFEWVCGSSKRSGGSVRGGRVARRVPCPDEIGAREERGPVDVQGHELAMRSSHYNHPPKKGTHCHHQR